MRSLCLLMTTRIQLKLRLRLDGFKDRTISIVSEKNILRMDAKKLSL